MCVLCGIFFMWVVRKRDKNKIKKYFYHFLGTTILISFIISSFVGAQWAFGPSQSWCWIDDKHQAMRFYVFYLIFLLSMSFCMSTVILASSSKVERLLGINKNNNSTSNTKKRSMDKSIKRRLRIYGSIFIFTWGMSFLDRFVQFVSGKSWFPLEILNSIFLPLQGFFYAIVYTDYFGNKYNVNDNNNEDSDSIELTCQAVNGTINLKSQKTLTKYSIFVTTLNLGEKDIQKEKNNLDKWLYKGHDIYAIGVQECMALYDFRKTVLAYLGGKKEYIMYSSEIGSTNRNLGYHGFIGLTVLVRRDLVENGYVKYREPSTQVTATGTNLLLTKAENKGGVGLPFQIHDVTIGFVTAHLPSDTKGKKKLTKRNESMNEILKSLILATEPTGNFLHHQVDHLIFLGDLNYRVNPPGGHADTSLLSSLAQAQSIEKDIIVSSVKTTRSSTNGTSLSSWMDIRSSLLRSPSDPLYPSRDTINTLRKAKEASLKQWAEVSKDDELRLIFDDTDHFYGFREPLPCFPPSYKRKTGDAGDCGDYTDAKTAIEGFSNVGDLDEDVGPNVNPYLNNVDRVVLTERKKVAKLRPPSYTDRILIHSLHNDNNNSIIVKHYDMCDHIRLSDHRPVSMAISIEADKSILADSVENAAGTIGMVLCSLSISDINVKLYNKKSSNIISDNISITSRSNSFSSNISITESVKTISDVENPINPSLTSSSKYNTNNTDTNSIGNIVLTFPLPSKDPIIDHKKVYDLSRSLRLGDSISSLNNISKIAQNNGVSGDSIFKLNNTFLWNEKNNNSNNRGTITDNSNDKSFSYDGIINIAGLIVPQTGCDVLLHINNNQQNDIGECAVNLIDLINIDTDSMTRSKTANSIPLTNGSRLIGELSGVFTLTFLAVVNEKQ